MDKIVKTLLGLLGVYLIIAIILSLQWRMQLDSPVMLYLAFLRDTYGFVPYRDFFDMNMPATYEVYSLIGRVSGFQDLGFRLVDVFLLVMIILATYFCLRDLGRAVAFGGGVLFALAYLGLGPDMSLQREYLVLVFIVVAVYVASSDRLNPRVRSVLVGLLFGLAAAIKPQAAIGLVPILALEVADTWRRVKNEPTGLLCSLASCTLPFAGGFAVPLLLTFAYLWSEGALGDFIDMASNYLPLYASLSGAAQPVAGTSRLKYLVKRYMDLGGYQVWLASGTLGIFVSLYGSTLSLPQKRKVILLACLTVAYSIYPIFTGQFWFYHWVLFLYFVVLLSSLCFVTPDGSATPGRRLFPIAVLLIPIVFSLYPPSAFLGQIRGHPLPPPKGGRVDDISAFLRSNLELGDLVQPLDWTGGAVHAMLMSKARLATPFVYDFYFYHHVSAPYIQSLRARFIESLRKARPRFIIQIYSNDKPWVSGPDTTREFRALQEILDHDYMVVSGGNGYSIYEIRPLVRGS